MMLDTPVLKINKINKDEDGDNMDDDWESENNLNKENEFDAFVDPDEDNLANQDEFKYGTDPYNPDTDGDGYKDGDEILKGSNPLDETSVPQSPAENKPLIESFMFLPKSPIINQTVMFNASSSYDPDGIIVSYEWDFGDGNVTATDQPVITHVYSSARNYTVTLTVTDNDGATNSVSKNITVIVKGDFNGNGGVDIGDAAYVAYMVVGKVKPDLAADINNNGRVDIGDLAKIAYYLIGKINKL